MYRSHQKVRRKKTSEYKITCDENNIKKTQDGVRKRRINRTSRKFAPRNMIRIGGQDSNSSSSVTNNQLNFVKRSLLGPLHDSCRDRQTTERTRLYKRM